VFGRRRTRIATAPAGIDEQVTGFHDLRRIGQGGFSVVYRARQAEFDRIVALKVLSVEFIDPQVRRRFLREVQMAGRLTGHPNVVTVLDSGMTEAGRPYLAMDFYERGSLKDRLLAEGPLPLPDVLRIGVKIAGALGAAHREGILHRDVKPQNILVSKYGEPALADFGTARLTAVFDASTRAEALTPVHAAPEVLEGTQPTETADVYSLGSTLYHLLAGRPAHHQEGDTGIAPLLVRILSQEPPAITRADVPPEVTALIRRAMDRAPERRHPSADALVADLQALQARLGLPLTEPAGGTPSGTPGPTSALPTPAASPWAPSPPPEPEAPTAPPAAPPDPPDPPKTQTPQGNPDGNGSGAAFDFKPTPWGYGDTTSLRLPQDPAAPPPSARAAVAPPAEPSTGPVDSDILESGALRKAAHSRRLLISGAVVVAVVGVAVPLALSSSGPSKTASSHTVSHTPGTATATLSATASAAPAPPGSAPEGLKATPVGDTVMLRWSLRAGNRYPLLVVQQPSTAGQATKYLAGGTTSHLVTHLDTTKNYCFKVGAFTGYVMEKGVPGTVAWSKPVCAAG
jgi:serine/threonine protein kinase